MRGTRTGKGAYVKEKKKKRKKKKKKKSQSFGSSVSPCSVLEISETFLVLVFISDLSYVLYMGSELRLSMAG
jgi:hypothetical protein